MRITALAAGAGLSGVGGHFVARGRQRGGACVPGQSLLVPDGGRLQRGVLGVGQAEIDPFAALSLASGANLKKRERSLNRRDGGAPVRHR
ncbi:hypothetical protein AB0F17_63230 [Nonomuraea sp. NPDC026600]|uniref:hypothetical protein n=1 Tax=Nonomuraea sp. NPDC026600 TaxID=3155363 RepID=UPI0033D3D704